jgi:hypothetical protein
METYLGIIKPRVGLSWVRGEIERINIRMEELQLHITDGK